jgi:iron complex transport system ATP-binding protein
MTVEVTDLSVEYNGRPVLRDLTLRVSDGEWVGLIGRNGAGKTTLLRAVAGLVLVHGQVRVADSSTSTGTRRRLAQLMAYVPQRPQLPASMTVTDYVLLGRTPYIPYLGMEVARDLEVVARILERLELTSLAGRHLGSLSGGEGQLALLARALAQEAPVLLLDEPTAALDVGHQQQVLELVDELRTERGLTVISAMHDLTLAGQFAERLLLLDGGKMVAYGPARTVLTEATIRRHYDASVRILVDADCGIAVLPTRSGRAVAREADGMVL